MPNRGRRNPRKLSRTRQGPAANALNNEQTNYRSMATEALRLLLAQHNLVQTGTRQQLVARLETHFNNPPPAGVTVADTSSTNTLPQQELAQIISSLIDEKLAARQDGGQPNQQHNWLAPTPHTGSYSTIPSPPAPSATQDGGQPSQQQSVAAPPPAFHAFNPSDGGQQQQQSVATPPPAFPTFNPSDPANVAALHPDFRQPSLASHLTKTTTTAITNGEYVDFATLLPISSLLEEARNSQLHLQVGAQGLTIPLPATSKRPKITSIEKWLVAFAPFLLGLGFHVSLPRHRVNCLPAVNQGRSEEIPRDGMVCLRRRVSASCLPQPFPQLGGTGRPIIPRHIHRPPKFGLPHL